MNDAVRQAVKDDGEIDWDCPCLQGMASGPCGEAFKAGFYLWLLCFHFHYYDYRL
jgi:intermembrane space import and assembly protein 40